MISLQMSFCNSLLTLIINAFEYLNNNSCIVKSIVKIFKDSYKHIHKKKEKQKVKQFKYIHF